MLCKLNFLCSRIKYIIVAGFIQGFSCAFLKELHTLLPFWARPKLLERLAVSRLKQATPSFHWSQGRCSLPLECLQSISLLQNKKRRSGLSPTLSRRFSTAPAHFYAVFYLFSSAFAAASLAAFAAMAALIFASTSGEYFFSAGAAGASGFTASTSAGVVPILA